MNKINLIANGLLLLSGITYSQHAPNKPSAPYYHNDNTLKQEGAGNEITVNQKSSSYNFNKAEANQNGPTNVAIIRQVFETIGSRGLVSASMNQTGQSNTAEQDQQGQYLENDRAVINQTGNLNVARQYQSFYENLADVKQTGNENTALQNQNKSQTQQLTNQGGIRLRGEIIQNNFKNTAAQTQEGKYHSAKINQDGLTNTASQLQSNDLYEYGILGSSAVLNQLGESNTGDQKQHGDSNESTILQTGRWNSAQSLQQTGDQYSQIRQTGDSNHAVIDQH